MATISTNGRLSASQSTSERGASGLVSPKSPLPHALSENAEETISLLTPTRAMSPGEDHGHKRTDAHLIGPVILLIRERNQLRTDLLKAEVRIGNQLRAIASRYVMTSAGNPYELEGEARKKGIASIWKEAEKLVNAAKWLKVQRDKLANGKEPSATALHALKIEANGKHWAADVLFDWAQGLFRSLDVLHHHLKEPENELRRLARSLPVWPWVEGVRGFGDLTLSQIIGETGDLSNYATHERLWKRLGQAVIDGKRQQKIAGDPDLAIQHGFSPRRCAVAWNLGACIKRAKNERYGAVYAKYRAEDTEKNPEMTKGHLNNRAMRVMRKEVLKDLWEAWRSC